MDKTIAAIATPRGVGAVAMIRISGKDCLAICDKIFFKNKTFSLSKAKANTIHYGKIIDLKSNRTIDEVMAAIFKEPASYTGQNSVEIYCHGGNQITQRVLEEIIAAGASLAEPGEFTKRAFLNGKLDLSQAEAVIDLINAKSDAASMLAVNQLEGNISGGIQKIRQNLVMALTHILAYIDFPDEDVEYIDENKVLGLLKTSFHDIQLLLNTYQSGKAVSQGIDCAIVGQVNAGKSSVMNCLTGSETSIVTEIEGTTRDIVGKSISIGTVILNLLDTAGMRDATDKIELIGIERAKQTIQKAELVLWVVDSSKKTQKKDRELLSMLDGKNTIIIANKCDLPQAYDKKFYKKLGPVVSISAKHNKGIKELKQEIERTLVNSTLDLQNDNIITNVRHFESLNRAMDSLKEAIGGLEQGFTFDVVSIDIQNAIEQLSEITGASVNDELIDNIFKQFCIGK